MNPGIQLNAYLAWLAQLARLVGVTYPLFQGAAASSDISDGLPTTIYSGLIYLMPAVIWTFINSYTDPPFYVVNIDEYDSRGKEVP